MKEFTFLRLLAERFDPDEIIDMLNLTSQEIVIAHMDEIMKQREKFMEYLDFEEFKDEI